MFSIRVHRRCMNLLEAPCHEGIPKQSLTTDWEYLQYRIIARHLLTSGRFLVLDWLVRGQSSLLPHSLLMTL